MFAESFQYSLRPEVKVEQFLAAIDRSQREFVSTVPGFQSRWLTDRENGSYSETILWESEDHMKAAMQNFEHCDAAIDLMKMIDESTLVAQHGRCVAAFGSR